MSSSVIDPRLGNEIVTISLDYNDYVRADEVARDEGSNLYAEIVEFIRRKSDSRGTRTVMRTPDEVRAHFNKLLEEARHDV